MLFKKEDQPAWGPNTERLDKEEGTVGGQNGSFEGTEDSASTLTANNDAATPPDGGTRAWLVTLGGFGANFCTFGSLNSFSVFQDYYATHYLSDKSASTISWIGSIQLSLLFLGGLFSGPLTDRYGVKAVLVPASIALVLGLMMTSLSKEYYQFLLAQGFLEGISFGMIYTPAVSVVGQYFVKRRGLALGVVAAGSSAAGVVVPIALDQLLNKSMVGFGWSIRIIGFILLALLACTCMVMKEHAPRRRRRLLLPEAFGNMPYLAFVISWFTVTLGLWTPLFYIADYAESKGLPAELAFYQAAVLNGASCLGRVFAGIAADAYGRLNVMVLVTFVDSVLLFCWTATSNTASITVFSALYGLSSGAIVTLYAACVAQVCPDRSSLATYTGMGLALSSLSGLAVGPINGALIGRYGYLSSSMFSAALVLAASAGFMGSKFLIDKRVWARV